ncbi:MAG: asparaginase domain-containing protein [Candidatus Marinimicrobia bacterium]|nr:asparaginase domain-containing protein [Candidatus Neomarinimicrobiota bacterium]MDD5583304.1 asparaginase domain-containing protein [Candidatus Neomarinimicrobiota bacterium]
MKITIITTGGTIEKTYNEQDGSLKNYRSILTKILEILRLPDLDIQQRNIIFKDSLDMTDEDRDLILRLTRLEMRHADAVIILHGTDTLEETGNLLYHEIKEPSCPIIFTGAMRPYEFRDSDAVQNVTESLLAARLVSPGIYVVMHNRILKFPGVYKDREQRTFNSHQSNVRS